MPRLRRAARLIGTRCIAVAVGIAAGCENASTPLSPRAMPDHALAAKGGGGGRSGKIAFVSTGEGAYKLYVMNPDGSGFTKLTDGPTDETPSWYRNRKIVFSHAVDLVNREIFSMNADGSELTRLTFNDGADTGPASG